MWGLLVPYTVTYTSSKATECEGIQEKKSMFLISWEQAYLANLILL